MIVSYSNGTDFLQANQALLQENPYLSTFFTLDAPLLKQADTMLQMPIMTPVSSDTWGVKEAVMSEADMPEWGSQEERGIEMEITTAAAVLAGGSDAVILRHPEAVKTIAKMIDALM